MSLRAPAAIAVGISLIVLPAIIVQAQSEGETEPDTDGAEQKPQESEAAVASEQAGSVLGAETSTETASSSDVAEDTRRPDKGARTLPAA